MGINMQDEEEVREYLDNLQTEYQFSCYRENNGEGCCLLGEFMANIREDYPKSASAFKKACDELDFPKACFKYGGYLLRGRAVEKNFAKALEYEKKGCDLGWKDACCIAAAQLLDPAEPTLNDPVAATKYFTRACEMESALGCSRAGSLYFSGTEGVPKDLKKALEFAARACELEDPLACVNAALMYKTGLGTEVDMEKFKFYKEKAEDIKRQMQKQRGLDMEQGV